MERTLVVFKPDSVARGLIGEILSRFEKTGLKIIGAKMLQVSREMAEKHYPADRKELWEGIGNKTLTHYKEVGADAKKLFGSDDAHEIGKIVRAWLLDYITSGPVLAVVLEAPHAVELVRKLCGNTLALKAEPGTIRGDYSYDSAFLANNAKRALKNMIHASGSLEEAKYEIPLWFKPSELYSYSRCDEQAMK
jgi:nucleoside-diphosphate kinase